MCTFKHRSLSISLERRCNESGDEPNHTHSQRLTTHIRKIKALKSPAEKKPVYLGLPFYFLNFMHETIFVPT